MIKRVTMGTNLIGGRHDGRRQDVTWQEGEQRDGARRDGVRSDGVRSDGVRHDRARLDGGDWNTEAEFRRPPPPPVAEERAAPTTSAPAASALAPSAAAGADRFVDDQLFEEDVRAVLAMMRPHRRERLMGWAEYRTGGANFRATISWDESFGGGAQTAEEQWLAVPRLTDVLESILVGSLKDQDELTTAEEFDIYRGVVRELYRRLDEMQSRYE